MFILSSEILRNFRLSDFRHVPDGFQQQPDSLKLPDIRKALFLVVVPLPIVAVAPKCVL
jgi:hypothetical protein